MKAEDTVIKELEYDSGLVLKLNITDRDLVQVQAEITWGKAISEVVGWIEEHRIFECNGQVDYWCEWQAQKKVWGI